MNRGLSIIVAIVSAVHVYAAEIPADVVMRLVPGTGQNAGQGPVFFPRNVLGLPDPAATRSAPAVDPRDVCSIGLGGEIVVGFSSHAIVDGPGPDFVIYENAFTYGNDRVYAEPARIAVSRDGRDWTEFPYNDRTLDGCAGRTPTDPTSEHGGGDVFDLSTIGMDSIRWVRIVDITQRILDDPMHPYYDPSLTGFDLDAVVGRSAVRVVDRPIATFDPATEHIEIGLPPSVEGSVKFYAVNGVELGSCGIASGITTIDATRIPNGLVIVIITTPASYTIVKVLR